jgi:predicted ATPase/class 3 adenylate cyclase
MADPTYLPTGTVTFLFTDVEGSTALWECHPGPMRVALARHDALIEGAVAGHEGTVVRPRGEGDSRFAVFARATDAVAAAAAIQGALHAEPWPPEAPLRVRLALHTGEADLRDGDYYGTAVNRAARLRGVAHGGQTLLSQAAFGQVRDALPPAVVAHDLGEHRLSDLARPERVYQLVHPDLPAEFPPLRSLDAWPNNLPRQLTSFVGRERDLAQVRRLLEAVPLLTLAGAGGAGKTRLALQAAADALEAYPDGVWLVELAPVADPALVPPAVAAALGVREVPGRSILATLGEALRPRRLLLVLDNCEHLVAACARLADALLRACPGLRILTTSREPLGIAGETAWRVPSLALPPLSPAPGPAPGEQLAQYEAVRLFIDRALAVRPDFAVTNQNAPAVAQLCTRLDGIPLAIELAAARVRVLPAEQLLARLEDRFRLLTGGSRTALRRQQTLQAAVDWSYDLLDEAERRLFARLSVFAGGWTLEAAEAVCADPADAGIEPGDVLDLLTRLVDKSLVVAEARPDGTARYRLLETLRAYGLERLAADEFAGGRPQERDERPEPQACLVRHAAYFVALAEAAARAVTGPEQLAWLDRLECEHDNLRAAMAWLLGQGQAVDAAQLGWALWIFWWQRGLFTEGRHWMGHAVFNSTDVPASARAKTLFVVGTMAGGQGDFPAATPRLEESLSLFRRLGDRHGTAFALGSSGIVAAGEGQHERAIRLFDEAAELFLQEGDRWGASLTLSFSAAARLTRSDAPSARPLAERGLSLAREIGDRQGLSVALYMLASIALAEQRAEHGSESARRLLTEGLALAAEIRDATNVACYLEGLAAVAAAEGRVARAARLWGAGEALRERIEVTAYPYTPDRALYEHQVAAARSVLDEGAWATAWSTGRAMGSEQAVAYALQDASAVTPPGG